MSRGFLDGVTAQRQLAEVARRQKVVEDTKLTATPELIDKISASYKNAPWAQPGIHLANAQSNAPSEVQKQLADMAANKTADDLDPDKNKDSGPMDWLYGKLKTASRWTFAAMQTVPDLAQNAASDLFDRGPEEGGTGWASSISGWWQSTSLGSMMSDSTKAGSGFFAGKEWQQLQAERARRYRGEINGRAFTVGRKAANVLGLEDGILHTLISGTLDGAINLGTDPTNAIGAAVKTAKVSRTAFKIGEEEGRLAFRLAAGLSDSADEAAWESSKTVNWLRTNTRFKNFRDKLANTSSISEVMEAYNWKISPEIAALIADETDPKKIENLFVAAATRLGLDAGSLPDMDGLPEAAQKLAQALESNGVATIPQNLRQLPGAQTNLQKTVRGYVERRPFGQKGFKFATITPEERLIIDGTGADRARAVQNVARAMTKLKGRISPERQREILDKFARAYASPQTRRVLEAEEAFNDVVAETMRAAGVSEDVIKASLDGEKALKSKLRAYNVNAAGEHDDGGMLGAFVRSGLIDEDEAIRLMGNNYQDIENMRFVGAATSVEFLDRVQILPDFGRINRLTSKNPFVKRVLSNAKGEARGVIKAADFLQNEIWKTTTLMTVGYIMRNLFDGQLRYSLKFSGSVPRLYGGGSAETRVARGFLDKPLDFASWAMHKTGRGSIMGDEFAESAVAGAPDAAVREWLKSLDSAARVAVQDQTATLTNFARRGEFTPVQWAPESREAYVDGVSQTLYRYQNDPIARILVETGNSDDVVRYLMSDAGKAQREELLDNLRNGLPFANKTGHQFIDPDTGKRGYLPVTVDTKQQQEAALKILVETRYAETLRPIMSVGNEDLRLAWMTNFTPLAETDVVGKQFFDDIKSGQRGGVSVVQGMVDVDPRAVDFKVGTIFEDASGQEIRRFAIQDINKNPYTGEDMYTIRYLSDEAAFVGERAEGAIGLRNLIKEKAGQGALPKWSIYENYELGAKMEGRAGEVYEEWRKISRWFFNNVSGKAMKKLEKDPIFRQLYYKNVNENIDLLSSREAQKVLREIESAAEMAGVKPEKWATKTTINLLKKQIDANVQTGGTARQLNEFAGKSAGYEMSDVLFDASSKTNLEEALRIAAPFGSAWREVLQKWGRLIIEDPAAVLRAQRAYNGLAEAEIAGGDGGFFYKDPVSGENMFTFPFSGNLTKMVSGGALEAPLTAPVKRLSMGFNVLPSVGPVGQIAASSFLPDKPSFDEIRDILLPYGEPKGGVIGTLVPIEPNWFRKFREGWTANTNASDTVFATTYVDVLRALSTNGEYDLSTEEGKNKLMDDAKQQAKWLTIFRAASQFIGPTAGSPKYKLNLKGGDVYASELVKEFQKMQAENYDTAVGRFLETFGEEAQLYISSKTRAKYGGLEATEEFNDFMRSNETFFNRYKEAAGYFAPAGSEFAFAAWDRQLRGGFRERLTDVEVLETAQNAIGSYKYRQLRLQFGSYPTEEQRAWLRYQRELLARQYPGFPAKAVFQVGQLEDFTTKLRQASQFEGISNLPVTGAITQYLDARDDAIETAKRYGVDFSQSKTAQPLRDWLLAKANELILEVPEFGRVFDRELAAEIED